MGTLSRKQAPKTSYCQSRIRCRTESSLTTGWNLRAKQASLPWIAIALRLPTQQVQVKAKSNTTLRCLWQVGLGLLQKDTYQRGIPCGWRAPHTCRWNSDSYWELPGCNWGWLAARSWDLRSLFTKLWSLVRDLWLARIGARTPRASGWPSGSWSVRNLLNRSIFVGNASHHYKVKIKLTLS